MTLPKYITVEITHNLPTWWALSCAVANFKAATMHSSIIDYSSTSRVVKVTGTKKLIARLRQELQAA